MRIWFPANLAIHVDDPVLNSIVPSASISSSSSCSTPPYQRTAVYATCDFTGGGTAITGVDVTSLVTFITPAPTPPASSPSIAIINSYIQARVPMLCDACCCSLNISNSWLSSYADVKRSGKWPKEVTCRSCMLKDAILFSCLAWRLECYFAFVELLCYVLALWPLFAAWVSGLMQEH